MSDNDFPPAVLIVNDNADKADFYQERFQKELPGVDIFVATDAHFARQLIEGCAPDVIVLDATIPETAFRMRLTPGNYDNSLSVARAHASQRPDGKIILLSSYAPKIGGSFPQGTIALHEEKYAEVPAIIRSHLGMTAPTQDAQTPLETTEQTQQEAPAKHISRIQAVRRSSAHDGSREGNQDSWSEQVGRLTNEDEVKRKQRSIRTV